MVHPAEVGAITLDTMIIKIAEEAIEEIETTAEVKEVVAELATPVEKKATCHSIAHKKMKGLEGMTEDETIGETTEGEITEAEMIEGEEREGMKQTERLVRSDGNGIKYWHKEKRRLTMRLKL